MRNYHPITFILSSLAIIFSSVTVFNAVSSRHTSETVNEDLLVSKQIAEDKAFISTPPGSCYKGLTRNELGFWEDAHGWVYELESSKVGIIITSPLGKNLTKLEQQALLDEKKEKRRQIEYHKNELEKFGVLEKEGRGGIPIYDAGNYSSDAVEIMKEIEKTKYKSDKTVDK